MSTYGRASQVEVQPFVASQRFRTAMLAELRCDEDTLQASAASSQAVQSRLADLDREGALSAPLPQIAARIGQLRRDEVAGTAAEVLSSLGYTVSRAMTGPVASLWAERGHEVFAMEVVDGGGFQTDQAGLDGGACLDAYEQFRNGMGRRGITWTQQLHRHNDPRGGQLIRRVSGATRTPSRTARPGSARQRQPGA